MRHLKYRRIYKIRLYGIKADNLFVGSIARDAEHSAVRIRQHVNMNERQERREIRRRLSSLYADAGYEVLIKGIYGPRRDI